MRTQINMVAAGVAVALSGTANAGLLGAANEIFVGGATAPQNFFREDIVQRICDPSAAPVRVYTDTVKVLPSETPGGNILSTADHQVVHCTAGAFSGAAAALSGQDVAIYKYNGGSATGVAPVADPDNATTGTFVYLDANQPANPAAPTATECAPVLNSSSANAWPIGSTANTYELYDCPDVLEVDQLPDAGISDVEPTLFVGPLALDFGVEPTGVAARPTQPFADQGNLNILPGPGLVFGVAVSLGMYDELTDMQNDPANDLLPNCPASPTRAERDSIACMPSVASPIIADAFGGNILSWAGVDFYGKTLNASSSNVSAGKGNEVHICKRTNGSGTHAQFSVHFKGTNCTSTDNLAVAEQNNGFAFPGFSVGVYANSGSSDMSDCVDAFGNGAGFNGDFAILPPDNAANGTNGDSTVVPGTALPAPYNTETKVYGMGYNSMENNTALTFDYRFVKVDWAAPTLDNAINGTYKDVYYLSFQNRVVGGSPDLRTGAIRTAAASAAQQNVATAYFSTWNAIAPAAVNAVNAGLVVDPDGTPGNADDWETGFVTPIAGASSAFTSGTPATPWTRQNASGGADSCQALSIVK